MNRVDEMRRLHAEILTHPKGSQERLVLEHQLAKVIRGTEPFDPKKAAAGDRE